MRDLRAVQPDWVGIVDGDSELVASRWEAAVDGAGGDWVAWVGEGRAFDGMASDEGEFDDVALSCGKGVGGEDETVLAYGDGMDIGCCGRGCCACCCRRRCRGGGCTATAILSECTGEHASEEVDRHCGRTHRDGGVLTWSSWLDWRCVMAVV